MIFFIYCFPQYRTLCMSSSEKPNFSSKYSRSWVIRLPLVSANLISFAVMLSTVQLLFAQFGIVISLFMNDFLSCNITTIIRDFASGQLLQTFRFLFFTLKKKFRFIFFVVSFEIFIFIFQKKKNCSFARHFTLQLTI